MRNNLYLFLLASMLGVLIMSACTSQEQSVSPLLSADALVSQENTIPVLHSTITPGATATKYEKCNQPSTDALSITESQKDGWCTLTLPLEHYAVFEGLFRPWPEAVTARMQG